MSIDSNAENTFVLNLAKAQGVQAFWIGLRLFNERSVWADDASRTYEHWGPGAQAGANEVVYAAPDGWHSTPMTPDAP